jgi:hypothetical protein
MHVQNLQWRKKMMGTEWDMLRGCSGGFVFPTGRHLLKRFTIKMLLVVWKFLIA